VAGIFTAAAAAAGFAAREPACVAYHIYAYIYILYTYIYIYIHTYTHGSGLRSKGTGLRYEPP
jgi:hypothetical protein